MQRLAARHAIGIYDGEPDRETGLSQLDREGLLLPINHILHQKAARLPWPKDEGLRWRKTHVALLCPASMRDLFEGELQPIK